jgi:SRSO17 transposase
LQNFISKSPWSTDSLWEFIARRLNLLVGGDDSSLILDETSFEKKGVLSVGVGRQYLGRLGKTDNGQVAVCASLWRGLRGSYLDAELYLPKEWTDAPERCARAGVPEDKRALRSKAAIALDLVRKAIRREVRFGYVLADAGYGKEPAFLRALDAMKCKFVVDVRSNQRVWLSKPEFCPPKVSKKGNPTARRQNEEHLARSPPLSVRELARKLRPEQWQRMTLREGARGPICVDIAHLKVWVISQADTEPRNWHLVVRREMPAPEKTGASPRRKKTKHQKDKEKKAARELLEKARAERNARRAEEKVQKAERKAAKRDAKALAKTQGVAKSTTQAEQAQDATTVEQGKSQAVPVAPPAVEPKPGTGPTSVSVGAPACALAESEREEKERREDAESKMKFSLSNAPLDTPTVYIARKQGERYGIERNNQDAKSDTGLADYRVVGWLAWGHHMVLVVLSMLFTLIVRLGKTDDETDIGKMMSFGDVVFTLKHLFAKPPLTLEEIAQELNRRMKNREASRVSHAKRRLKARDPPLPLPPPDG